MVLSSPESFQHSPLSHKSDRTSQRQEVGLGEKERRKRVHNRRKVDSSHNWLDEVGSQGKFLVKRRIIT